MPVEAVPENGQPGFLSILLLGLLEDRAPQVDGNGSADAAPCALGESEDDTEEEDSRLDSPLAAQVLVPPLPLSLFRPELDRGQGDDARGIGLSPESEVLFRSLVPCAESALSPRQPIAPVVNESAPAEVSSASDLWASNFPASDRRPADPTGADEPGLGNAAGAPFELSALRAWHRSPSPSPLAFAVRLSPRADTSEPHVEGDAKSLAPANATLTLEPKRPELPQKEAAERPSPTRVPGEEVVRPSDLDPVPSGTEAPQSPLRKGPPRSEFQSPEAAAETDSPPKQSEVARPQTSHAQFSTPTPVEPPVNALANSEPAHAPTAIASVSAREPVDPPAAGPAPLRDLAFRLEGAADAVEVRLSERGGTVHVSVHTADADLAGTLRQNLGELSTRLDSRGFQAETSQPTAASEPARADSDPRNDSGYGKQHGGDSGRHDQPPRRRQSQNEKSNENEKKEFSWIVSSTQ